MLQVKNLKKYFLVNKGFFQRPASYVKAVDDVSLDIQPGENLSIVGESGSGKSTLARVLMKLYEPTGGDVFYKESSLKKMRGRELRNYRQDVQMVFQNPFSSLDPRFTVRRIIAEALLSNISITRSKREEAIRKVLLQVNLPEHAIERFPHEFSGGERQRIAIARALVSNPKYLILDEAVSALDVLVQEQIISLLNQLKSELFLTYIFISHNLRVVKKISHKVAVMYKGRIVEYGTVDDIFKNAQHTYTQNLLTAALKYQVPEGKVEAPTASQLTEVNPGHMVLK